MDHDTEEYWRRSYDRKGTPADIPHDIVDSTRVYHYIVCRLPPLPPILETPRLAIQKMLSQAMEPTAGLIEYLKT